MERVGSERVVVAVDAEDTPWCSTGPDLVADRLFQLGASAVSELPAAGSVGGASGSVGDAGDGARSRPASGAASGPIVRMVADLPAASLDDLIATGWRFDVLEADRSWSAGWRDHAAAVEVGERLVLRPEWVQPDVTAAGLAPAGPAFTGPAPAGPAPAGRPPAGLAPAGLAFSGPAPADPVVSSAPAQHVERIEVVLDAASAFGSGSHPTTRLCLEALESLDRAGELDGARVFDVGCGSGVLGVAALLLGAGSLVAVDVEDVAVAATDRTAELNGVTDRAIEVSARTVDEVVADHGPFDIVLANLLVPIIEQLGPSLAASVAPGGRLVLSGLLADPAIDQVGRAISAVSHADELVVTDRLVEDGWVALVVAPSAPSNGPG